MPGPTSSNLTQPGQALNTPASNTPSGGNPPWAAQNDVNPDELSQLQPTYLTAYSGGTPLAFPAILWKQEDSNALADHEFPNLPGARIENLGAHPSHYFVRACFTNHIYPDPSKGDTWKAGTLFPNANTPVGQDTFSKVRKLLSNSTQDLILGHPIDGEVVVQLQRVSWEINARGPRDGAFVDMEFVTTVPEQPSTSDFAATNQGGLSQTVKLAQAAFATMPGTPISAFVSSFLGGMVGVIQSAVAIPTNAIGQIVGIYTATANGVFALGKAPFYANANILEAVQNSKTTLNATANLAGYVQSNSLSALTSNPPVVYDPTVTQTVTQSIMTTNNAPSANASQLLQKCLRTTQDIIAFHTSLNNYQFSQFIDLMRQTQYQLLLQYNSVASNTSSSASANSSSTVIRNYITPSYLTFPQLAAILNNAVNDIMNLNPTLTNQLFVPANRAVKYYQGLNNG